MAQDIDLQAIADGTATPAVPQQVAPQQAASTGVPVIKDPAELKQFQTIVSAPGFFSQPPVTQRAALRQLPSYKSVPDADLDRFTQSGKTALDRSKPGILRKIWENVNSPVKAFTGKSLEERYASLAPDFVSGKAGNVIEQANKANQAISDAGFGSDSEADAAMRANATPEGRAFTHRVGENVVGFAESPLTYVGLGEGLVNGPGAARLVGKVGEVGKAAQEALKGLPSVAKVAGEAGPAAARLLKGVQTAQMLGGRAFQIQALAGVPVAVKSYLDKPGPETAADALFAAGIGAAVGKHVVGEAKANFAAGDEAVRVMERARDLAWHSGTMRLETMPADAARSFMEQAFKDVTAKKVPGTQATGLGRFNTATQRKREAVQKAAAEAEARTAKGPDGAPLDDDVAAGFGFTRQPYQSAPGLEVQSYQRPGVPAPAQYEVNLPEQGLQPASNFEANARQGFTMPGGTPTPRPPAFQPQITGNIPNDGAYQQPAGAPGVPPLGAPQGGAVPALRGPMSVQSAAPIEVNEFSRAVQPASNFEAGSPNFRMGGDPSSVRRPFGPAQIEGSTAPPGFTMPDRGAAGPVTGSPVQSTPAPPAAPSGPPPVPSEPELLSDGRRKWMTGTFEYPKQFGSPESRPITFPTRATTFAGQPVTVMGPAYPDAAGGLDKHQLFVIHDDGTQVIMDSTGLHLPNPGKEGSQAKSDHTPLVGKNPSPPPRPDTPFNRQVEKYSQPEAPPLTLGTPTSFTIVGQQGKYKVDGHFAVVPSASVVTSHDTSGNPNPGFPAELQPRMRDRASSDAQVNKISNELDLQEVAHHPRATGGAPVMNKADRVIEGGNGRSNGIKLAYERKLPSAARYRQDLIDRAGEFGLDPAHVASVENPMLVRVRGELPQGVTREQFAADTNKDDKAGMSPLEEAMADQRHLTPDVMAQYDPSSDLTSQKNADFVRDFFKYAVAPDVAGTLQTGTGGINAKGVARVKAAIFARAYGNSPLLESMSESADPEVRNIITGLQNVAPAMISLDTEIKAGSRYRVSITTDLAWAANKLAELKRRGMSVGDFLAQGDFLNGQASPLQKDLLKMLDGFSRSGSKIGDTLTRYVDAVNLAGDPRQVGMFEQSDPPRAQDLLEGAIRDVKEAAGREKAAKVEKGKENVSQVQQAGPGESREDPPGAPGGPENEGGGGAPAASSQPAPAGPPPAPAKAEVSPPPGEPSLIDEMMQKFLAMQEAKKNGGPKDRPLAQRGDGKPNPLAALAGQLPEEYRQDWLDFTQFFGQQLEQELQADGGAGLSEKRRGEIAQLYPDLATKYLGEGAPNEESPQISPPQEQSSSNAPAPGAGPKSESGLAGAESAGSGGSGPGLAGAAGGGAPGLELLDAGSPQHDGLRPDDHGNAGRNEGEGHQPDGQSPRVIDFQNKRVISAGQRQGPPPDESVIDPEIKKYLKPQQAEGAASAIHAMNGPETGALNADGTGFGKSLISLAVAKHYLDQGYKGLVVSKAEAFKFDYKTRQPTGTYAQWSKTFGIPIEGYVGPDRDSYVKALQPGRLYAATYDTVFGLPPREIKGKPGQFTKGSPGIAHLVDDKTILILDEAHALKNSGGGEENRANAGVDMANRAAKVLMLTATPGDKPVHIQYLQRVGLLEGKTQDEQFNALGFTKKTKVNQDGKETVSWSIDKLIGKKGVRARLDRLFDRLIANGQMVKREIAMDGVDMEMIPIELPEEGYAVLDRIEGSLSNGAGLAGVSGLKKASILGHMRRAQETYKIPHAVRMANEELNDGRKVVIFVNRVNDSDVIKRTKMRGFGGEMITIEELIHTSEGTAGLLKQQLLDSGLTPEDIAEIHGEADEKSVSAMQRFQDGKARVVIATIESGGTGINLDDQKGTSPRTMIILTAPFDAVGNVQAIGRIWRMATMSGAKVRYVFANTQTDLWNMGIIADKMKTLGVIVSGEAKGAMAFENIKGNAEIRKGYVPTGEYIEDDDPVNDPDIGQVPKDAKGKILPEPVEGGWLKLTGKGMFDAKEQIKKLGGKWDGETKNWHIPDSIANREAVAKMKKVSIDGPSDYGMRAAKANAFQAKKAPLIAEQLPKVRPADLKDFDEERAASMAALDAKQQAAADEAKAKVKALVSPEEFEKLQPTTWLPKTPAYQIEHWRNQLESIEGRNSGPNTAADYHRLVAAYAGGGNPLEVRDLARDLKGQLERIQMEEQPRAAFNQRSVDRAWLDAHRIAGKLRAAIAEARAEAAAPRPARTPQLVFGERPRYSPPPRGDKPLRTDRPPVDPNDKPLMSRTARPPVDRPMMSRAEEPAQTPGPVWYSQLQRTVESKMPAKASVDQIRAIIRNPQNGVKADEIKWTGLDDWLSQQKGSVTKQEVTDYLKQNAVEVKEILKGGPKNQERIDAHNRIQEISRKLTWSEDEGERRALWEERDQLQRALSGEVPGDQIPKYSNYKTPGGTDYGELLLIAPNRTAQPNDPNYRTFAAMRGYSNEKIDDTRNDYSDPVYREWAENRARVAAQISDSASRDNYTSAHWDEKNIIAHIRFEQRRGPDRSKHFLIVENQSDWGQQGRDKGFRDDTSPEFQAMVKKHAELSQEAETARLAWKAAETERTSRPSNYDLTQRAYDSMDVLKPLLAEAGNLGFDTALRAASAIRENADYAERWDVSPELKAAADDFRAKVLAAGADAKTDNAAYVAKEKQAFDKYQDLYGQAEALAKKINVRVPAMPFSKTWHELAFRRSLRWAVEHGFDRLSWEKGDTHADRYDLSKQVSKVTWEPFGFAAMPTNGELLAYSKEGEIVSRNRIPAESIPDYIGKDAAKKLLESAPQPDSQYPLGRAPATIHLIEGDDLRVGNQGMREFYDKMLPNYANKLAKKWGSSVEKKEIKVSPKEEPKYVGPLPGDNFEAWYNEQTRSDRDWSDAAVNSAYEVMRLLANGMPLQEAVDESIATFGSELAQHLGGKVEWVTTPATAEVWSLEINKEMRDSVMQGQPLFARTQRPPVGTPTLFGGDVAVPKREGPIKPAPTSAPFTFFTGATNPGLERRAAERGDVGLMVTPLRPGSESEISKYPVIAVDNGVFSKSQTFSPAKFRDLIEGIASKPEQAAKVRFVIAPDVIGDAKATLAKFPQWADEIHSLGLPVAFAAQNGIEHMRGDIPWDKFEVLFVGGNDAWKDGTHAKIGSPEWMEWIKLFQEAKEHGKEIHVGRVNSMERMELALEGIGASSGDGTGAAFHPERTVQIAHRLDRVNSGDFGGRRERNATDEAQFDPEDTDEDRSEQIRMNRAMDAQRDKTAMDQIRQAMPQRPVTKQPPMPGLFSQEARAPSSGPRSKAKPPAIEPSVALDRARTMYAEDPYPLGDEPAAPQPAPAPQPAAPSNKLKPRDASLFEAQDDSSLARQYRDQLLGDRLTAHFNAAVSAQENAAKLKKKEIQQDNFFAPLRDDPQSQLFLKGLDEPVPAEDENHGKADVEKTVRQATMRVYGAVDDPTLPSDERAIRIYFDPAAHLLVSSFSWKAGLADTEQDAGKWAGLAMKPHWLSMIAREMRNAESIGGTPVSPAMAQKLNRIADMLDNVAVSRRANLFGVSLLDARYGYSQLRSNARHEQAHADALRAEMLANFQPEALFGQENLNRMHQNPVYQEAAGTLYLRGYAQHQVPLEIMAYVEGGGVNKEGKIPALGITPEQGLGLYADLLQAAVDTKGDAAYTVLTSHARKTIKAGAAKLLARADRPLGHSVPGGPKPQGPAGGIPPGWTGSLSQGGTGSIQSTGRPPV